MITYVNRVRTSKVGRAPVTFAMLAAAAFFGSTSYAGTYTYASDAPTATQLPGAEMWTKLGPVTSKEGIKIGVVLKTLNNQYWQAVQKGMVQAGKDLGVAITVQAANTESDPTQQLTITQTMIGRNFDAFVLAPETTSNLSPAVKQLQDMGKPIVNAVDARFPATTFVGSSHELAGSKAADYIAEHLADGGDVAQIEGSAGSTAAALRIKGFKDELAKHSNLKLVASVPGNWDASMAYNDAQTLLRKDPNIKAFYANNDTMAVGVAKAVGDMGLGGKVMVVGTDGTPAALADIENGAMAATVTPLPYYEGYWAIEAAVRLINGEKAPEWIVSPAQIITKDNITQFYQADRTEKVGLYK
jgi:ribose transport system substrate-binding protein